MKLNILKFNLILLITFFNACDHPETSDAPGLHQDNIQQKKNEDASPNPTSVPTNTSDKPHDSDVKISMACPGFESLESGVKYTSNKTFNLNNEDVKTLYENGSDQTLCKILADAKSTVVTMQFSGIYCLACQEQAKMFTQKYATTDLGKSIKHIVVFIDAPDGGFDESEFDDFLTRYAKDSWKKYDSNRKLYNKLFNNPTTVKFGASFAFNAYGDQYFQESAEGNKFESFVSEVQKLVPQK